MFFVFKTTKARIGTVELDASISETHAATAVATRHPVESGADVSDHVHLNPRTFLIEGLITNHPLEVPGTQADGVAIVSKQFSWETLPGPGAIGAVIGVAQDIFGLASDNTSHAQGFSQEFDRVKDAYDEIDNLVAKRQPILIITALREYENMILESFETQKSAEVGEALRFTCSAVQIRVVTSELADAIPDPSILSGLAKAAKGGQPAGATDDESPTKRKSSTLNNILKAANVYK